MVFPFILPPAFCIILFLFPSQLPFHPQSSFFMIIIFHVLLCLSSPPPFLPIPAAVATQAGETGRAGRGFLCSLKYKPFHSWQWDRLDGSLEIVCIWEGACCPIYVYKKLCIRPLWFFCTIQVFQCWHLCRKRMGIHHIILIWLHQKWASISPAHFEV